MSTHPFQTFRLLWLTLWRKIPRRLPPDLGPTMQRLYYPMLFIGVCFYVLVLMLRMTQAQKIDPTQPATAFALPTGRTPLITPSPASNPQSPQPTTAIVPPPPTPSIPVADSPSPDSSSTDSASTPTQETQAVDSSETTEQSNPTEQSESSPTAKDSAPETETSETATSETGKTEAENPETFIPAEDPAAQTTKTNPSETAETQASENSQQSEAPATPEPAESLDNGQIVETNAQNPAIVPEKTNSPQSPQTDSPKEATAVRSTNPNLAAILPMIAQVKAMPSDWMDSNLFAQPQFFFQGTDAATDLQYSPEIVQLQWISLQHPDQVLETLASSCTSGHIELEAQGNYGGGGVYALKQGTEILGYVNLVPTKMGVGTLLVIWKEKPRLMVKPAFT